MKNNLYIVFTMGNIHKIGGMEMYVSGITRYMEKRGFSVVVFFPCESWGDCDISSLGKYIRGGSELYNFEPSQLTVEELDNIYNNSLRILQINPNDYENIYIESHADKDALWAEYYAKRFKAKHIALLLNEYFNGKGQRYSEYLDYFKTLQIENRLFGDFPWHKFQVKMFDDSCKKIGWSKEPCPIANVENAVVSKLRRRAYNIAYIGRGYKEYVPTIIREVGLFAKKYKDFDIQFVFVGDSTSQQELINELDSISNITIKCLGNLIPIPRELFKKVDVVIANSQTAYYCSLEKVYVLTVSSVDYLSRGILGRDCFYEGDANFNNGVARAISVVLEDVFVLKNYNKKDLSLPERVDTDEEYGCAIESFEKMQKHEYYDVCNHVFKERPVEQDIILQDVRREINRWHYNVDMIGQRNVVIYGAGYEGRRCLEWMNYKGYSPLLIIDSNSKKWGTNICGYIVDNPDSIKNKKIDCYIICCLDKANEIFLKLSDEYGVKKENCTTFYYIRMSSLDALDSIG